jgi:hypothetical protein
MSQVEANATMESIFSGYKFVPEEDVPASVAIGVGLSPAVEAGIPALVDAVARTAGAWGFGR